jgi:hypothetical protein
MCVSGICGNSHDTEPSTCSNVNRSLFSYKRQILEEPKHYEGDDKT